MPPWTKAWALLSGRRGPCSGQSCCQGRGLLVIGAAIALQTRVCSGAASPNPAALTLYRVLTVLYLPALPLEHPWRCGGWRLWRIWLDRRCREVTAPQESSTNRRWKKRIIPLTSSWIQFENGVVSYSLSEDKSKQSPCHQALSFSTVLSVFTLLPPWAYSSELCFPEIEVLSKHVRVWSCVSGFVF